MHSRAHNDSCHVGEGLSSQRVRLRMLRLIFRVIQSLPNTRHNERRIVIKISIKKDFSLYVRFISA